MTEQTTSKPAFWQSTARSLGGCLRLLLFALTVIVVTAALYYAIPYVYRYLITPVQNNQAAIRGVQREQTLLRDELDAQLADQRERIAQLEANLAAEREARSELEAALLAQEENLATRVNAQAQLEARLEAQDQTIATLGETLGDVESAIARMERSVASASLPKDEVEKLQRDALVLQMEQVVLKARLHLLENNPGQAQLALEEARPHLQRLSIVAPSAQDETLAELEGQFDTTITAIEDQPFIALQELEILWQLLGRFYDLES